MSEAKPAQSPDSQHFQRGVEIGHKKRETEIIALLESWDTNRNIHATTNYGAGDITTILNAAVKILKGETK